jgi:hypothetical protein
MLDQYMKKPDSQPMPIAESVSGKSCIWCRHQTYYGRHYLTGKKGAFICHFSNESVTKVTPICAKYEGLGNGIEIVECEEEEEENSGE